MKDPDLTKEYDRHAATFPFADLRLELSEERFDFFPLDVPTGWVGEDQFEGASVLSLHL